MDGQFGSLANMRGKLSTYMIYLSVHIHAFAVFLENTACSATSVELFIP
jgi:hypothetical protein